MMTFSKLNIKLMVGMFSVVLYIGCGDSQDFSGPGIILTFDDRNMLNWEKQIALFAKYDAQVTFFVDCFDKLNSEQLQALKKIKEAGHTIGCHGFRHIRAAEYCEKHTAEKYFSDEIEPAITTMTEKGFPPICFAYPYSNRSLLSDSLLLKHFKLLRSGGIRLDSISLNNGNILVNKEDIRKNGRLDGVSFHPKTKNDELVLQVKEAIRRIQGKNEFLVLYSHDIRNQEEEGPKNYITIEALEEVLSFANSQQIKLYSFEKLLEFFE